MEPARREEHAEAEARLGRAARRPAHRPQPQPVRRAGAAPRGRDRCATGAAAGTRAPARIRRRDRGRSDRRARGRQRRSGSRLARGGERRALVPRQAGPLRPRRGGGPLAGRTSPASASSSSATSSRSSRARSTRRSSLLLIETTTATVRARTARAELPRSSSSPARTRPRGRRSRRTPLHTLVFLSTDGGAYGSMGLGRFVSTSPLARRAGAVVSLDGLAGGTPARLGSQVSTAGRPRRRSCARRSPDRRGDRSEPRPHRGARAAGVARVAVRLRRAVAVRCARGSRAADRDGARRRDPAGADELAGIDTAQLGRLGRASETLLTSLDAAVELPSSTATLYLGDRAVRGWALQLLLVALAVRGRRESTSSRLAATPARARSGVARAAQAARALGSSSSRRSASPPRWGRCRRAPNGPPPPDQPPVAVASGSPRTVLSRWWRGVWLLGARAPHPTRGSPSEEDGCRVRGRASRTGARRRVATSRVSRTASSSCPRCTPGSACLRRRRSPGGHGRSCSSRPGRPAAGAPWPGARLGLAAAVLARLFTGGYAAFVTGCSSWPPTRSPASWPWTSTATRLIDTWGGRPAALGELSVAPRSHAAVG